MSGELGQAGVVLARAADDLLGAMIGMPVAGASGLVWPPQARPGPDRRPVEDELVRSTSAWLRGRGAKLAQALLVRGEMGLAEPLLRNGFAHLTSLWYMRHDLQLSADL